MTYQVQGQSSQPLSTKNSIRQAVCHALVALSLGGSFLPLSHAQEIVAEQQQYRIAAGSLEDALAEFAQQAGILISFEPELVVGKQSSGLQGNYTAKQALSKLLQGTGLDQIARDNGSWGLRRISTTPLQHGGSLPEVKVRAAKQSESLEDLPSAYRGGQVATGGRVGLLGNLAYQDTPFSITSYTRELIQNQQATTIADVVANDASVRSANPRGGRFDQFSIRGFTVSNGDIALNGLYGLLSNYAVAVETIERVEVLKGTSALLNGMAPNGAVGGAINVVTKRAQDVPITQLTTTYASKAQWGAHVDVGRRFGPDNSVGIRVNAAYRSPGETAFDHQSTEQSIGSVALDYRGNDLKLSLDMGHQERNVDAPPEKVTLAAGVAVPDAKRIGKNFAPAWTYTNTRDTYAAIRAEYDFNPNWSVYAAIGGKRADSDFLRVNPRVTNNAGNFTASPFVYLRYEDVFTAEAGLRTKFATGDVQHAVNLAGSKFRLDHGGAFYYFSNSISNIYQPPTLARPNTHGLSQHIPKAGLVELNSIALTDTLSMMNDRLQLIIGARSQQVQVDTFDSSTRISHYDKQALTPATAVVLKLNQHVSLYGNYIESLSQGQTAPTNGTVDNAGQVLPPIKSKQLEAGVKMDWGHYGSTLSLFRIEQPSAFAENRIFALNGEQRNVGIEWNVFGEPVAGLRTLGGIMLLDSKLTSTQNGTNDGAKAPGTSRSNFNFGVEWDAPAVEGLTLTARTLYSSSQYMDVANTQKIPSWVRFDIGARYAIHQYHWPVTLRASVENLFDRSYWASAAAPSGASGLTISTPRTLLLSATIDF